MGDSHFSLVLAALAPLAAPCTTHAQEVTVLTEDLCETCSIEVTPDVELGTDGESVIGIAWDIARLSDGRFVMPVATGQIWRCCPTARWR